MIICEQMIGFGYWVTLINYRRCRKGRGRVHVQVGLVLGENGRPQGCL